MKTNQNVTLFCILIFLIITIIFTVGYSTQTLISAKQIITMPPINGVFSTMTASEILTFNSLMISSNDNASIDYSNFNDDCKLIFKGVFGLCVSITSILGIGIILSLFNKIFISKIIFLIALILMLIMFMLLFNLYLTITIASIGTDYLSNFIANYLNEFIKDNINNTPIPKNILPDNITPTIKNTINYDNGFILMSVATLLMFINHFIFMYYG